MSPRATLARVLHSLRKTAHDGDLTTEPQSHLQLHTEHNIAQGMTPAEARRQALLKLGGLEQTKEAIRDQRTLPLLESLLQDVRFAVRTFDAQIDRELSSSRLLAVLAFAFGSLAALLAAMGIYALLAYTVSQRTREIGVHMALGAERRSVALPILRDVALLSGLGVILGVSLTFAVSKLLNSMLYNVQSFSAFSLSISLLILGTVAALAAFLPVRRASQVDPNVALRYE